MAKDCILGAVNSVIISTNGRPAVPDPSFSHPIVAVEFILTRVPIMSESSRAPNIIPVPPCAEQSISSDLKPGCTDTYEWGVLSPSSLWCSCSGTTTILYVRISRTVPDMSRRWTPLPDADWMKYVAGSRSSWLALLHGCCWVGWPLQSLGWLHCSYMSFCWQENGLIVCTLPRRSQLPVPTSQVAGTGVLAGGRPCQ